MESESSSVQPGVLRVFQSKAETRSFYNKICKVYDLMAEHSEEPVRQAALEKLDARPGEYILEIGLGTGHCLVALAASVGPRGQAYGLDLSDGMLLKASQLLGQEQLQARVSLTCGDAANLPYRSASLDAIFMSFTLELFDTPELPVVLGECMRVLRPRGRIVVAGMSKEGEGLVTEVFEWTHRHFPNFLDCRPIFVRQALQSAGFHVQDSLLMQMWVPVEVILASVDSSN